MKNFNAILLRLLRESNGFTQDGVCKNHHINQSLWSKWERGLAVPTEQMIERLVSIFRYPKDFFLQPIVDIPTGLVYHRKRTALHADHRAKIEARARLMAFDAVKLCRECGVYTKIIDRNGRSAKTAARDMRKEWSVGRGPILNLIELLEKNGVVVISFDFETDLIDGFFLPIKGDHECVCIALNANEAFPPDRQRFTLAHELGHAVLHRSEFVIDTKTAEREANAFASEFLLPEEDVSNDLRVRLTFDNLRKLKIKWHVSMAAIARRANDLGIANDRDYRTTCYFLASSGYRKHEPDFGQKSETASLLRNLIVSLLERGENPDDILMLSAPRLSKRYGIKMEEVSGE